LKDFKGRTSIQLTTQLGNPRENSGDKALVILCALLVFLHHHIIPISCPLCDSRRMLCCGRHNCRRKAGRYSMIPQGLNTDTLKRSYVVQTAPLKRIACRSMLQNISDAHETIPELTRPYRTDWTVCATPPIAWGPTWHFSNTVFCQLRIESTAPPWIGSGCRRKTSIVVATIQ